MGETRYEMAYERCTPMRDARLWDGFCEKHAYKKSLYEMAAYAYKMAYGRGMPMRWSL
jgi:hypothetical protein